MNPSEGLKQFLYDRFLHFLHLTEDISTTEIEEFANLARLQGLASFPNLTGIHVIDCIGNNEPINNTSIAEKMNLSKANITKVSTQLHTEGFIKRSQMNDNKKEVYFSLSPKGRQVFEAHTMMHEKMKRKFFDDLNSFSESELQASLKFFQTIINQNDNVVKADGKK
ncbi:MarR family transcriptional regulator [Paenibacillus alba]|uniref:MarR family transcriptional regulator n=1 Tax=Paenibacillus alba TaxID=1197127 RepID=A0ABU6FYH0_9BACL|nr:MarR family transcriptional regulator [Paenibacillus alba]MEC0226756.1 MarR family transcriptional regulator [Paenibacillus alba]NQX68510.1 MarR family transcriptional regulator [Paenibacillus alba]